MSALAASALIISSGVLSAAAFAQSPDAVEEEIGPPHESLGRAAEEVHAVFCKLPDRDELEAQFRRDYGRRVNAVQKAVAAEFGEEVANRSWISVLPCHTPRSEFRQNLAIDAALKQFERELERWEKRYHLRKFKKDK